KLYYFGSIDTNQDPAGETSQMTITANPITKAWTEGTGEWNAATLIDVNWINASTGDQWSAQGGDFSGSYSGSGQTPTSFGWTAIDCKAMVNAWLDSTINNIGMILRADQAHEYLKYFRSSDWTTAGERPKLEVTYVSNHKPIVRTGAIENLNFYEDDPTTHIDLNDIFTDQDDGDVLTFSVWTGTEWNEVQPYDSLWITAEILVNDSVEVTPKPNKFGADTIQLNATDTSLEYAHHSIIVVILPVNDAPRINATTEWKIHNVIPPPEISPGKVKGKEDVFINLTVSAFDPVERDALTYSDNTTLFNIDSKTGYISFRPKNSDVGTHYVEIEVDDGGLDNNIDTLNVEFEITNTNDAPVISKFLHGATVDVVTPAQDSVELSDDARQDQYYNFTIVVIDDDMSTPLGDILGFKVTPEDKFTVKKDTIDPTKANVSFKPTYEDIGDFEAEVRVTDSINYFDDITIIIEVKNINDAPLIFQIKKGIHDEDIDEDTTEIALEDENEATEHKSYTFTVLVRELDPNDVVEFSTDNDKLFKLTANDDETDEDENIVAMDITFTPTWEHGRLGYATINVTVKDNLKAFDWLIVNVSVKNQNDAPMIIGQGIDAYTNDTDKSTRKVEENLTWTFEADGIVDPDGDRIFYYWDFDEDDGRTDDEDAEGRWVMWTFEEGREYTITLTVMDSNNAINTTLETITVIPPGTSSRGEDDDKEAGFPFEWLIIGIVILLVIILVIAFLYLKKKREEQEEEEEE
ncbi:MAG: DNRLRE domain-containing protein, partial [Thermoplasmata archaeon]|nr:DNRLRE domain-containing protein [Thermoplasmata archaeon]